MRARLLVALFVPIAMLAACTLPTDERATRYDADDLPPDIANTTTTTTSTTTTTTTTLVPPVTGDSVDATTSASTTQPPALTAPVDLFYTIGFQDELAPLRVDLQEGAPLPQVLAQLEQPLPQVADFGLRTAVRRDMIDVVRVDRGAATVVLNQDVIDQMSDTILRRAISQIVLTVTSFRPPDAGGIGTVQFEVDGEGFPVFVPAFGGSSEPAEGVAFSDFASLIGTTTGPTTTSTTTIVPETTAPPDTAPDDTAG